MIPADLLRDLRNNLPVRTVISRLAIPTRMRRARLTFRCPLCGLFCTALNEVTNLARCFPCRRNFNTIDLIMAERAVSFLEAVGYLEHLLGVTR